MFKNYVFRRLFASTLLAVFIAGISVPSLAMLPSGGSGGSNGHGGPNQSAVNLFLLAAALAYQAGTVVLQQTAQTVAGYLGYTEDQGAAAAAAPTPERPTLRPAPADTPDGYVRVHPNGNLFGTPGTLAERAVVYNHLPVDIRVERIDLQNQRVTRDQAEQLLRGHPQFALLLQQRLNDVNRYIGQTKNDCLTRQKAEVRAASKPGRKSRHLTGLERGLVGFVRNIFINAHPGDRMMLEALVIEILDTNAGRGLNSNGGKRVHDDENDSDLDLDIDDDEVCAARVKRRLDFGRRDDGDDSSDDGSDSSSGYAGSQPLTPQESY